MRHSHHIKKMKCKTRKIAVRTFPSKNGFLKNPLVDIYRIDGVDAHTVQNHLRFRPLAFLYGNLDLWDGLSLVLDNQFDFRTVIDIIESSGNQGDVGYARQSNGPSLNEIQSYKF